jgi:NitT/TauT family transport system substrate-binding protein
MRNTFIVLLLISIISGCQKSSPQNPEHSAVSPLQKITFAYTYQPQCTLVHVALAKGYFVEEGLEVQSLMHTYGKAALQSVVENKADFATVAETPVMFNVLNGEKIYVIANIEASTLNNGIVARKDAVCDRVAK